MITFRKEHSVTKNDNVCVAFYVQNIEPYKISPLYATNHEDVNLLIPTTERSNIVEYVDRELFRKDKQSRHPEMNSGEVTAVVNLIAARILPKNWPRRLQGHPLILEYWTKIYNDIQKRMIFQFIAEPNFSFFPCPSLRPDQRDNIIVYGPSGIGKSVFCMHYITTYNKTHNEVNGKPVEESKRRKIYLLSQKPQDKSLDTLKFVIRIKQEDFEEFITIDKKIPVNKNNVVDADEPERNKKIRLEQEEYAKAEDFDNYAITTYLAEDEHEQRFVIPNSVGGNMSDKKEKNDLKDISNFANSLFVFDDIETMFDEILAKKLYAFKEFLIKLGRSNNIDIIYATHSLNQLTQFNKSQITESTALVFFPHAGSVDAPLKILKDHYGLDAATISKIREYKTWVMVTNYAPKSVLTEREFFLMGKFEINDRRYKNYSDLGSGVSNNNNILY